MITPPRLETRVWGCLQLRFLIVREESRTSQTFMEGAGGGGGSSGATKTDAGGVDDVLGNVAGETDGDA